MEEQLAVTTISDILNRVADGMGSAAHDETGRPVEFEDLRGQGGQDLPPRHVPPADPAAEPEPRRQRGPALVAPVTPHCGPTP
eukprot:14851578-Heterocapsa_arctica.AAC.1